MFKNPKKQNNSTIYKTTKIYPNDQGKSNFWFGKIS